MTDEVVKLAYDAALAALKEQDNTLSNLRNRTASLITTASAGTAVAVSVGLLNSDPRRGPVLPVWSAWSLLIIVSLIGIGSLIVLSPIRRWHFGPAPAKLLASIEEDEPKVRMAAAGAMVEAIESNSHALRIRGALYRANVLFLLVEVIVLLVSLLIPTKGITP